MLIVDDDSIVRYGLKNAVDWETHDFKVVGEASNGQEALQMIGTLHPDLVITDILMPIKNGIELIEDAVKLYDDVYFLILSCYGEFGYVQKALRLGALDYLLKSTVVNGQEFLDSLLEAKKKIDELRLGTKESRRAAGILSTSREKEKFLAALIAGGIHDEAETKSGFEDLGLSSCESLFMLAVEVNHWSCIKEECADHWDILGRELVDIIKEAILKYCAHAVFMANENCYVCLLDLAEKNDLISDENKIVSIAEVIRLKIKFKLHYSVNIYISKKIRVSQIAEYYKRVEAVSRHKIYFDGNMNIMLDSLPEEQADSYRVERYGDKLTSLWDQKTKFFAFLQQLFCEIAAKSDKLRVYEGICFDAISVYNKMANYCLLYLSDKAEVNRLQCIQISEIYIFDDVQSTYRWLKKKFEELYAIMEQYETPKYNNIANEIIKYIDHHYSETINLDILEKQLNFNKYYLCRMFKEETGDNITDYINNKRILKAKELLKDEDSKISFVAKLVGYNDATYFNRVFKSIVGISPSNYKKQFF